MVVLPLIACLLASAFAATTARAAVQRGSLAAGVWSFALVQFAVASAALSWGIGWGWTPAAYRVFYLFGAVLNVAWLGLGTVWLLLPRAGAVATLLLLVISVQATGLVATLPLVDGARVALAGDVPAPGEVMPPVTRALGRWLSIVGTVVILAGLVWSMVSRRVYARGLGLLAAGVVVAGLASQLGRAGVVGGLSAGLALGIGLMYAGFVRLRPR